MLVCYCILLHKLQRPFLQAQATLENLELAWEQRQEVLDHDNSIPVPLKFKSAAKIRDTLEDIDNYLSLKKGTGGMPLAYIVRPIVALPGAPTAVGELDPGYGGPSFQEEMIRRTRHNGAFFRPGQT